MLAHQIFKRPNLGFFALLLLGATQRSGAHHHGPAKNNTGPEKNSSVERLSFTFSVSHISVSSLCKQ
jgi:hypothetical protein